MQRGAITKWDATDKMKSPQREEAKAVEQSLQESWCQKKQSRHLSACHEWHIRSAGRSNLYEHITGEFRYSVVLGYIVAYVWDMLIFDS